MVIEMKRTTQYRRNVRRAKTGLKVLQSAQYQSFYQLIFAGLFWREQHISQMHRFFAEEDNQNITQNVTGDS